MKKLLLFFFLLPTLLFSQDVTNDTITLQSGIVTGVHDGDSYFVNGKWIRLSSVDCPEVVSNIINQDQPLGRQVADSVRMLLKGKKVDFIFKYKDFYNRDVVSVTIQDSLDLSALILQRGWGEYRKEESFPDEINRSYKKLETVARKQKVGIWAVKNRHTSNWWRKNHRY